MKESTSKKPGLTLQTFRDSTPRMNSSTESTFGEAAASAVTPIESSKKHKYLEPLDEIAVLFYDNFMMQRCLFSTTITHWEDINSQYTVYHIEVKTIYLNYTIHRRFSQFKDFRKHVSKLKDQSRNCPKLENVYINKMGSENKNKRMKELQEFLNFFMDEFFKEQLRSKKIDTLLASPVKMRGQSVISMEKKFTTSGEGQFFFNVSHEKYILDLLQMIQDDYETKRTNIKQIGQTIAESPPIINSEFISLIIRGSTQGKDGKPFKGLVQLCGRVQKVQGSDSTKPKHEHSHCKYNLEILNSILECEKNPNYEMFLKDFQEMPIPQLSSLSLDQHILSDRPCKLPALKLFMKFIEGQQRTYASSDWEFIIKKLKILRYKEQVFREIENYQPPGKQLKKAQSSVQLDRPQKRESISYRVSQPWLMSLSYLDQESILEESLIQQQQGNQRQMKELIEDYFAGWNEVYSQPEKGIRIEHTFPQTKYVRIQLVLPLTVKESLNLLVKQRKAWDSLLLQSTSLGSESQSQSQQQTQQASNDENSTSSNAPVNTNSSTNSNSIERVVEIFDRGYSNRIQFFCEERIEVTDEGRCMYISRSPYTPTPAPESSDALEIGEWENLIMIKDITSSNNTGMGGGSQSISKWMFHSIDMDTSSILLDKQIQLKSTSNTDPFNFQIPITSIEEQRSSNNNSTNAPPPILLNFNIPLASSDQTIGSGAGSPGEIDYFAAAAADTTPKGIRQRQQSTDQVSSDDKYRMMIQGLKHHEISERESESNLSSTSSLDDDEEDSSLASSSMSALKQSSSGTSSQQSTRKISEDTEKDYPKRSKEKPKQFKSREDVFRSKSNSNASANGSISTTSANNNNNNNNSNNSNNPLNPPRSLPIKSKKSRPSIRLRVSQDISSSSSSFQDDSMILPQAALGGTSGSAFGLTNSITVSTAAAGINRNENEEVKMQQSSSQYSIDANESTPQPQCQVAFLFNLLNKQAIYFFSKFISKGDNDSLLRNAQKLHELAQKVRKESASTTDSNRNFRKESNESVPSNPSDQFLQACVGMSNAQQATVPLPIKMKHTNNNFELSLSKSYSVDHTMTTSSFQ